MNPENSATGKIDNPCYRKHTFDHEAQTDLDKAQGCRPSDKQMLWIGLWFFLAMVALSLVVCFWREILARLSL